MWLTWRNIEGPKAHRTGLDSERVVGVRVVRGAGLCHCHGYKECTGCYVNAFKAYNSSGVASTKLVGTEQPWYLL